jgi:hypothetical protein
MARACPACGRPNSEQSARCLYCTEPFDRTAPDEPVAPAIPISSRHLIILAPQGDEGSSEERAQSFAEVLGLAPYDARLALKTLRHRLLCKVEGQREAREISIQLERLGVEHLHFAEADVEAVSVDSMRWLRFHTDHMEMQLSDKGTEQVSYEDVLLLVRGEIARERHNERRVATPQGASQPLTPGLRLFLFVRASNVAAELDSEQFDWSALGDRQSISTPMNFKRLVDEILHRATSAELDRGFDLEPVVLSRSEAGSYVDALLDGSKARDGVVYDNEAQFRFYARWRYLVACARAHTGGERN